MNEVSGLLAKLADLVEQISSLTFSEIVYAKATLLSIQNREYQCGSCLNKYAGRRDAEAMSEKSRASKFCTSLAPEKTFIAVLDFLKFRSCPGNFTRSEIYSWLSAYQRFKAGLLPYPGAYLDQPNKVIELFDIFQAEETKQEIERAKQLQREQKARSRRGR